MSTRGIDHLPGMPNVIRVQRQYYHAIERLSSGADENDPDVQRIIHGLLRDHLVGAYGTLSQLVEALTSTAYPKGAEGYRQRLEVLGLIGEAAQTVRDALSLAMLVSERIDEQEPSEAET